MTFEGQPPCLQVGEISLVISTLIFHQDHRYTWSAIDRKLHEISRSSSTIMTYNTNWQRFQLQPCHHWQEASLYCKGVLHESPPRTPDFVLEKNKDERPLGGEVSEVQRTLHNCVDRASFLTETTIDALCHVDI